MGRPALYDTPTFDGTVRIRQQAYEALNREAEREGRPVARLIADAIERDLARRLDGWEPALRPDVPDEDTERLQFDQTAA